MFICIHAALKLGRFQKLKSKVVCIVFTYTTTTVHIQDYSQKMRLQETTVRNLHRIFPDIDDIVFFVQSMHKT